MIGHRPWRGPWLGLTETPKTDHKDGAAAGR